MSDSSRNQREAFNGKRSSPPLVCGIVEGIVPTDHPNADIRGLAAYVEGHEIERFRLWPLKLDLGLHLKYLQLLLNVHRFIIDIEEGRIEPVVGGSAAMDVFKGQGTDINFEEIMGGKIIDRMVPNELGNFKSPKE